MDLLAEEQNLAFCENCKWYEKGYAAEYMFDWCTHEGNKVVIRRKDYSKAWDDVFYKNSPEASVSFFIF